MSCFLINWVKFNIHFNLSECSSRSLDYGIVMEPMLHNLSNELLTATSDFCVMWSCDTFMGGF